MLLGSIFLYLIWPLLILVGYVVSGWAINKFDSNLQSKEQHQNILLKNGADPNTKNGKDQETCLILAINENSLDLVKLLMKNISEILQINYPKKEIQINPQPVQPIRVKTSGILRNL